MLFDTFANEIPIRSNFKASIKIKITFIEQICNAHLINGIFYSHLNIQGEF